MTRSAPYDRETALDAAMALFWEKGFHATSLKDLEAALAMKPGSIYAAFASKENLYLLALERYFAASIAGFRDQLANGASPLDVLADQFRAYARLPAGDRSRQACMLTRTLVDTRTTEPVIADATRAYLDAVRDAFAAGFVAAKTAGELSGHADPHRLARRFQANLTALRLALHQGMQDAAFSELAEDMAREIEQMRVTPD
jgi:TetR/AcrR family transcriptional regulator, transcriptional repressor for nem operon